MVTINKALDNLIDALAGSDVPVTGTKATRVDQLAEMISDGEIVIGGGGGNDDIFIANFGADGHGGYTCDKTFAEILAAFTAGKTILGYYMGSIMNFLGADAEHGAGFSFLMMAGDTLTNIMLIVAPDDSITDAQADYDLSSLVQS